jgi:hypothetical protein
MPTSLFNLTPKCLCWWCAVLAIGAFANWSVMYFCYMDWYRRGLAVTIPRFDVGWRFLEIYAGINLRLGVASMLALCVCLVWQCNKRR